MRYLICVLLLIVTHAYKLDLTGCSNEEIGNMKFHICDNIEAYSKVYLHDPTGDNMITIIPGRLYQNHGYYVAYSSNDKLYIASRKYDKSTWFENYHLLTAK